MKNFQCDCGQRVFFESSHCVHCGTALGYDPVSQKMVTLRNDSAGAAGSSTTPALTGDTQGHRFRHCDSGVNYDVCNWLVKIPDGADAGQVHPLCFGCRFNRYIPFLGKPENVLRWRKFEFAKKRLLFTLQQLQLPLENGFDAPGTGMQFDFVEDERSDPERYPESFSHTGHSNGLITINVLEADDAAREGMRAEQNQNYRTLLGHLRHESGHFYYMLALRHEGFSDNFRKIFGEPRMDYQGALNNFYQLGPRDGWRDSFISAYASSHPHEDWAESWGHYLHIYDSLETASALGITSEHPDSMTLTERFATWQNVSVSLNELNRSSGLPDVYPFVLNENVKAKMAADRKSVV